MASGISCFCCLATSSPNRSFPNSRGRQDHPLSINRFLARTHDAALALAGVRRAGDRCGLKQVVTSQSRTRERSHSTWAVQCGKDKIRDSWGYMVIQSAIREGDRQSCPSRCWNGRDKCCLRDGVSKTQWGTASDFRNQVSVGASDNRFTYGLQLRFLHPMDSEA